MISLIKQLKKQINDLQVSKINSNIETINSIDRTLLSLELWASDFKSKLLEETQKRLVAKSQAYKSALERCKNV